MILKRRSPSNPSSGSIWFFDLVEVVKHEFRETLVKRSISYCIVSF
jgi:hypothetical protein